MFQTVGHEAVTALASCVDLPLFRGSLSSDGSIDRGEVYEGGDPRDEVEALKRLIEAARDQVEFEAVCSGAILSDYQRVRVENV